MLRLALGTLRHRVGAFVGTFVAAVLAVALLAAGGLLLFSVLTAKAPADRFAASDLVVSTDRHVTVTSTHEKKKGKTKTKTKSERLTGAGTLPPDLADRLSRVPGVAATVADSAFPVVLVGPHGQSVHGADDAPVIGHGWGSAQLTPYALRTGRTPRAGEAVIDADLAQRGGLSVGSRVMVTSRAGTRPLVVSGVAAPSGRAGLPAQGALFVADSAIGQVSGLSGPTAVGVQAVRGTSIGELRDGVRSVAGDLPVRTGGDRVEADLPGAVPDYIGPISIFGFTIGITGFAAVFVLTGTVSLGVRQRLRELALLRTAGATPRQLRRLLGAEAVVLAILAAIPAVPLGIVLSRVIAARFKEIDAIPAQFEVRTNPAVLVAAVVVGVLLTFVSARVAGRRAAKIAPTQALAETAVAPTGALVLRTLIALITAGGAVAVLTFVPLGGDLGMGMSFISSALLLCAVAALGPVLVHGLTAVFGRVAGLGGVTAWLAGLVTRAESRRVAAVAVPLVLMFAINATMLLTSNLLTKVTHSEAAARGAVATAQVTSRDGIPLTTVADVVRQPGVTGSAATVPTSVILPEEDEPEDHPAQGIEHSGDSAIDLGFTAGNLGGAGTFAASKPLASAHHWKVGESVSMWLADGYPVTLRLTGIYERARGFGELALPGALVASHDPRGLATGVALRYDGDVASRITARWPDLTVTRGASTATAADTEDQEGAWEVMMAITLGFTAIAVINTFAISASGRRREYADLRLAGATVGQVRGAALREAVVTVAVGLVLGAIVTGIVVGAFSIAQDGAFRIIVDPARYAALAGGVAALGLVAGIVPTRVLLRRRSLPDIVSPE
ncbi:permease [Luteipulveratus mongoliensis]|uniref:Permease n=2 Tax=Luteipulveratus mongoliensis TaxID=571913 RepID=A0A0K1JPP6_9MICO|nr:permease [Luteipulveratus mongoliensis]